MSAVTVLVALVLVLVPALAWLQYQWVGQLSQAERERMQRTLRTAASQFAVEFDSELSSAMIGLQVDGPMLRDRDWSSYGVRYSTWVENAGTPKIVRDVLLVDAGTRVEIRLPPFPDRSSPPTDRAPAAQRVSPDAFTLLRWNAGTLTFEPIDWPPDLAARRASMAAHLEDVLAERSRAGGDRDRYRRDGALSQSLSDDQTLVNPVTLFEPSSDRQGAPRISILGFTIVRLDPAVIRDALLAPLAARHLHGDDGASDYRIAVVSRADPSAVVWESEPGAARTIGSAPDVSQDFMAPRPERMFYIARNANGEPPKNATAVPRENIVVSVIEQHREQPDGPVVARGRALPPVEGRWRLIAKHRAGSLEAAVAAVRMRNLLLSSGILLLLTTAVGLIVVSARRAQQLARQQMEFVAAVSHELRTPVSVIGAAAGNLADGVVGDPARVRKYGETIQGEARRLAETVERVLQLAGIAAGRAAAAPSRVHPADLINASLGACRTEIEAAGCTVETDIAPDLPMVQGDVVALRSALQNLISNAVKYGGEARWLRVSADGRSFDKLRVVPSKVEGRLPTTGRSIARSVVFTVDDRGVGIDAEDRKRVFEPFYRGRVALDRQIQGSGLGLSLVERIAHAHGGEVTVASEPGKGSTFTLTLPAAPEQAPEAPAPDTYIAAGLPAGRH